MTDDQQPMDPSIHEEQPAETWQEELPPLDDFHDQPEAESMGTGEAGVPPAGSAVSDGAPKKKGTKVFFIILAVGIIFIGGLIYLQVGRKSGRTEAPFPIASTMKTPESLSNTQMADLTSSSALTLPKTGASGVVANDVAAIYGGGTGPEVPAYRSPSSPETPPVPETNQASQTPAEITSDVVAPAAGPATEPSTTPKVSTVPANPLQPTTAVPAPTSPKAVEARLDELSGNVANLEKSLEKLSQQVSQLSDRVAAQAASSLEKDTTALEGRLKQIERKLADAKEKKTFAAAAARENTRSQTSKPHTKKQTARKAEREVAPPKESVKPETSAWVLRAATADAVWVSKTAQSAELQRVQVGDTLAGVGKVKSIHQTGDKWVVEGTQGAIR